MKLAPLRVGADIIAKKSSRTGNIEGTLLYIRNHIVRSIQEESDSINRIYMYRVVVDHIKTWNVLNPDKMHLLICLLRENMHHMPPMVVHLAAGSGFITKQLADAMHKYELPFENVATDSKEEDIANGDIVYFPVATATALETLAQYPLCRVFFVSRGRAFMLEAFRTLLEMHPTGALIIILATEMYGCCEPEEFFDLLDESEFHRICIDDGLIDFPRVDIHNDGCFIFHRNACVSETLLAIRKDADDGASDDGASDDGASDA
jgi:hypothetical protein